MNCKYFSGEYLHCTGLCFDYLSKALKIIFDVTQLPDLIPETKISTRFSKRLVITAEFRFTFNLYLIVLKIDVYYIQDHYDKYQNANMSHYQITVYHRMHTIHVSRNSTFQLVS